MALAGQVAAGDIRPSRFVKKTDAYTVDEVDAVTDTPIGISSEGSDQAPIPGVTELAASAGGTLRVYENGDNCLLELGGTVGDGAYIKPDAQGRGVAAGSNELYYAYAERGGASGEKAQVYLRYGRTPT